MKSCPLGVIENVLSVRANSPRDSISPSWAVVKGNSAFKKALLGFIA